MIDTTVKFFPVSMVKMDMTTYPRYEMPEGFYITGYREGDEQHWADIAMEQFAIEKMESALNMFHGEFTSHPEMWERLKNACLFAVEEKTGKVAAMLALWEGGICGKDLRRVHWVATREEFQGKGIIKAMLTYAMDLYHEQNGTGPCVLATGTQNWKAIRIYKKFGFEPYLCLPHQPEPDGNVNLENDREGWSIIDGKIAEFEESRK